MDGTIITWDELNTDSSADYLTFGNVVSQAETALFLDVDGESVNLSEFIKNVKESLGQSPVIVKCVHCGQWGAKYCACRYCGAPVG